MESKFFRLFLSVTLVFAPQIAKADTHVADAPETIDTESRRFVKTAAPFSTPEEEKDPMNKDRRLSWELSRMDEAACRARVAEVRAERAADYRKEFASRGVGPIDGDTQDPSNQHILWQVLIDNRVDTVDYNPATKKYAKYWSEVQKMGFSKDYGNSRLEELQQRRRQDSTAFRTTPAEDTRSWAGLSFLEFIRDQQPLEFARRKKEEEKAYEAADQKVADAKAAVVAQQAKVGEEEAALRKSELALVSTQEKHQDVTATEAFKNYNFVKSAETAEYKKYEAIALKFWDGKKLSRRDQLAFDSWHGIKAPEDREKLTNKQKDLVKIKEEGSKSYDAILKMYAHDSAYKGLRKNSAIYRAAEDLWYAKGDIASKKRDIEYAKRRVTELEKEIPSGPALRQLVKMKYDRYRGIPTETFFPLYAMPYIPEYAADIVCKREKGFVGKPVETQRPAPPVADKVEPKAEPKAPIQPEVKPPTQKPAAAPVAMTDAERKAGFSKAGFGMRGNGEPWVLLSKVNDSNAHLFELGKVYTVEGSDGVGREKKYVGNGRFE